VDDPCDSLEGFVGVTTGPAHGDPPTAWFRERVDIPSAEFFEANPDHADETHRCNSNYHPVANCELNNIGEIDIHAFVSFQALMNEMRQIGQ
jgi:hypothetical protein